MSVEFPFNDIGEVTSIFSPGRFDQFDGGYRQVPCQGNVRDYQIQDGMRVPRYGEVGWYVDSTLQIVWKATSSVRSMSLRIREPLINSLVWN